LGVWVLGIGDGAQSPIPNPQSPIPNPQSPYLVYIILCKLKNKYKNVIFFNNILKINLFFEKNE